MSASKIIVHTEDAPAPIGPYSQAVSANGFVFASGQIAIDPALGKFVEGDAANQTIQIMKNLQAVLSAAGTSFDHIVKATIFVTDMGDFHAINEVYKAYFDESQAPARAVVQVAALPLGAKVEIEVVATK